MSTLSASAVGSQSTVLANGSTAVSGLVSGIDTTKLIQGLLAIEQQKITRIDAARSVAVARQSAFKGIEARLLAIQGQMTQLSRTQNGLFDARIATSSDETALTAAASSSAAAGVYQMRIGSLARAHQMASQGFDAVNSTITEGTIQVKVGDVTSNITIDSTNNTLQGLAAAINKSGAAVYASVINDGSGENSQGYRLILAAKATGVSNRIVITNNLAASAGGATQPTFDAGSIGRAVAAQGNTGTSVVEANAGAGYVGTTNNRYTFTVVTGGAVGTDDGLQIAYSDATGANTGTLTVNASDVGNYLDVAEGVQVQFAAGTVVAGETFEVKTFVPTVQDATDASVTLGSGPGALTITNATNSFDSLIPGVALQLHQSDPTKELTLTVANDTAKMKQGITDFIDSYNGLLTFIDDQSKFDTTSNQAGLLLGNRQASAIKEQVRSVFQNVVAGANPALNYLGALGITTDDQGHLVVNDAKLTDVLEGRRAGVTIADVRSLFALTGTSTNSGIQFVTGSTKTKASATPYTVNISQAAEVASLTGSTALSASTVISSANNTFNINLDGKSSSTLTLADGTYTRLALAQAVQAAINSDTALAGARVDVGLSGDSLLVRSGRLGAASQVVFQSGSALSALGFAVGAADQGQDVVGSFLVNGNVEPAIGSGQFLSGSPTNANTADLQLNVSLTSAQVGAGIQADVSVVRGIASRLDAVLNSFFDPVNGRMKTIDDTFVENIDRLDQQKATQNDFIQARTESLQAQFAAMEATLSKLQSASSFLNTQATNTTNK